MRIFIDEYGMAEIVYEEGSTLVRKKVTLYELAEAFTQLLGEEKKVPAIKASSLLPQNTIAFTEDEKQFLISIIWGPNVLPFLFEEYFYLHIPFPRLLFKIYGQKSEELFIPQKIYVTALRKNDPINEDTPLYRYPYTHVYQNFAMCAGTVQLEKVKKSEPRGWETLIRSLLTSSNKNELYHINVTNLSGMNMRELLEYLDGKNDFPDEFLSPAGVTLKDFIFS